MWCNTYLSIIWRVLRLFCGWLYYNFAKKETGYRYIIPYTCRLIIRKNGRSLIKRSHFHCVNGMQSMLVGNASRQANRQGEVGASEGEGKNERAALGLLRWRWSKPRRRSRDSLFSLPCAIVSDVEVVSGILFSVSKKKGSLPSPFFLSSYLMLFKSIPGFFEIQGKVEVVKRKLVRRHKNLELLNRRRHSAYPTEAAKLQFSTCNNDMICTLSSCGIFNVPNLKAADAVTKF